MHWNHKVMRRYSDDGDPYYTVHEFYFNNDGSILGYVEKEEAPFGDTLEELKGTLQWMLDACDGLVIDQKELEAYFEAERARLRETGQDASLDYEPSETYSTMDELLDALETENE